MTAMRRGFLILLLILALGACSLVCTGPAKAETCAEFIDRAFLDPHNSPITGQMVVDLWRWYEIPAYATLTILGAESSMGDPVLGGRLVQHNNFGCIRAGGSTESKWAVLACGTVRVAGRSWWSWPTPAVGMAAWGRYIKVGLGRDAYRPLLWARDWARFANIYYGRAPGLASYKARLRTLDRSIRAKAAEAGWLW